jgi:TctA family transporter
MLSGGSLAIFFTRPIALLFMTAAILAYLTPLIQWGLKSLRPAAVKPA